MTLAEILTAAKQLTISDQVRLIIELLQGLISRTLASFHPKTSSQPNTLVAYLSTLTPLNIDFPNIDEGLLPLEDDIDL
jgi:hypothetical protein